VEENGYKAAENACFGLFNAQKKEQLDGQQAKVNAGIDRGAGGLDWKVK